jgi:purine catabolism regulator
MHLTVREALTIYPLSEAKLIAGREGDSRIVKSVNVMDAPDIADWIKAGEMLFTTGFAIKDHAEDGIMLIRKLNQRGAAGLGIKLGRFLSTLPAEITAEADRLHFPLIEMPFQFTFSDQMNALFQAEYRRNTEVLRNVLEKQKRLMQFALKQDDFLNMFHIIAGILGYPMAVVGSNGNILYNTTSWRVEQILHQWPWKGAAGWIHASRERAYRITLQLQEETLGSLLIMPDDVLLAKVEEGLFHQAAEMLSHHMALTFRDHVEASLRKDLQTGLDQYLEGKVMLEELLQIAETSGVKLINGSYQCVWATQRSESGSEVRKGVSVRLKELRKELMSLKNPKGVQAHFFYVGDGLLSIYSTSSQAEALPEDELTLLLSKYAAEGALEGEDRQYEFYVSRMKAKPEDLKEAYEECLETYRLSRKLELKDKVLHVETIEFAILFQNVPAEVMESYCQKVLQPLLEKDADYSQEMIRTLEVFIRNDGQVNEAARQLFIHRNTVTYRLEKISDLLQVDFKKVNDLLKLKLVFMFRHFLQVRP